MQMGSSNNTTSSRAKGTGKAAKRSKADADNETLHLKGKRLVTSPVALPAEHSTDIGSMIATAAYYRAVQRGFEPGHELEDWLQAEQQVRSYLPG
jgi:Protein of unknown function (DUF2934)